MTTGIFDPAIFDSAIFDTVPATPPSGTPSIMPEGFPFFTSPPTMQPMNIDHTRYWDA